MLQLVGERSRHGMAKPQSVTSAVSGPYAACETDRHPNINAGPRLLRFRVQEATFASSFFFDNADTRFFTAAHFVRSTGPTGNGANQAMQLTRANLPFSHPHPRFVVSADPSPVASTQGLTRRCGVASASSLTQGSPTTICGSKLLEHEPLGPGASLPKPGALRSERLRCEPIVHG
jgi:hypothetical protein